MDHDPQTRQRHCRSHLRMRSHHCFCLPGRDLIQFRSGRHFQGPPWKRGAGARTKTEISTLCITGTPGHFTAIGRPPTMKSAGETLFLMQSVCNHRTLGHEQAAIEDKRTGTCQVDLKRSTCTCKAKAREATHSYRGGFLQKLQIPCLEAHGAYVLEITPFWTPTKAIETQ